ncbi:MAG: exopolysaccharide biosynthesis polyprenyl glycosylphosphotransferase, partial [Actinomycetota bacterium]|nr:exopolysaccharide biosynthesis polyprenyl glycosylphosphotransferase [Actinomycetota bacterium]
SHASGIIGYCDTGADPLSVFTPGVAVLGDSDHIDEVAAAVRPDQVVVLRAALKPEEIRRLSWKLEGLRTSLVIDQGAQALAPERFSPVTHSFGRGLAVTSCTPWTRRLPRDLVDRVAAALLLVLLSPMLLAIAVLVRIDSSGPAFFVQRRVGVRGVHFGMVKFRSMSVDAEELADRLIEASEGNEILFKMCRDPRVTRIGRWLRSTSMDELPQLLNVVRGEMSLIGPRPALPGEVAMYDDWARRRLAVKPGMTGLWQVSGRSKLSWSDSVRLDLDYVDHWTPIHDVAIALRTVKAVVSRDGAY